MLLFPPPALAQEETIEVSKSMWFWSSNSKVTTCTTDPAVGVCVVGSTGDGVSGGTPPGVANPISTGHIAVSMKDGGSDMRSYLQFDMSSIPPNVEILSFVVTLTVSDPNPQRNHLARHAEFQGDPPATINQNAAGIIACAVTEPWDGSPFGGEPPSSTMVKRPLIEDSSADDGLVTDVEIETTRNEPFSDCSLNAMGEVSTDFRTWSFDITEIAQRWATLELFDEGIALLPVDRGIRPTWTVELHGPALEVREEEETRVVVTEEEAARATVQLGGEIPIDAGPPPPPPPPPPAAIPPPPPIFPDVTPPPPTTSDPGAPQVLVPVSGTGEAETPAWLFGLIPIGLLGLGLTSSAIGAEGVGLATRNRVASVLRGRRLGIEADVEPFESGPM